MIAISGAFFTSLLIVLLAVPPIVRIAEIKHLFDEPDTRKVHRTRTPTLGGIAIFAALAFSLTFWSTQKEIIELQYILSAIIIVFFIGLKDDLFNLVAYKKLIAQILASIILVCCADIRINTFYGLFGIFNISFIPSLLLSIFTIIVIINSFNLIDGVDCLAGSIGSFACFFYGSWFILAGHFQYSILAFSLLGALLGFLFYNRSPAKIFMGDTGSLIVGIVLSILTIKFIEINRVMEINAPYKVLAVPVVSLGVLIIPLFDTLRVFLIRALNGQSPLRADCNHVHHVLLSLGLTHMQITGVLIFANILVVGLVCCLQFLRGEILLFLLLVVCWLSNFVLRILEVKKTVLVMRNTFN